MEAAPPSAAFTALLVAAVVVSSWMAVRAGRAGRNADRRFQQVRKLANTFLFSFHDKIENLQGSTKAREFVVRTALEYLDSLASKSGNDIKLQEELAQAYLRVSEVQGDRGSPTWDIWTHRLSACGRRRKSQSPPVPVGRMPSMNSHPVEA